jgi:hypothetical protein
MKRLIVCCDGTWNSATDVKDGVPIPTNVVKFRNALADTDSQGREQRIYYHPGVGVGADVFDKLIDGATGRGLSRNIQSAYKWLSDNYDPDANDAIFVLGFSRGAFTVRSLVGLLTRCGIPRNADWELVQEAYDLYRLDPQATQTAAARAQFLAKHNCDPGPQISFLGVWDTVGSLGIPKDLDWLGLEAKKFEFHSTTLSPAVRIARHAIAVDEQRSNFTPTLWTEQAKNQDVKQVWFPGVHCDVGGGYKETGLSDGALRWMIKEAAEAGAAFKDAMVHQLEPDTRDVLHNSFTGVFHLAHCQPRSFPCLVKGSTGAPGQSIHDSTVERVASPPIEQAPYRETTVLAVGQSKQVSIFARDFWNWTGIYLEAGTEYSFVATGSWQDAHYTTGPEGMDGGLVHWLEASAKRVENAPWFCLICAIGDAGNPDNEGNPQPMTVIAVGRENPRLAVKIGGYLYGFANDAVPPLAETVFYRNNRGSVQLQVTRTK